MAKKNGTWFLVGAVIGAALMGTISGTDIPDEHLLFTDNRLSEHVEKGVNLLSVNFRYGNSDNPDIYVKAIAENVDKQWADIEECLEELDNKFKNIDYAKSIKETLDDLVKQEEEKEKEKSSINSSGNGQSIYDEADALNMKFVLAVAKCL